MHPETSLHLICISGKQSKIRITGIVASNALGDKIPMFRIGKSLNPHCSKGVKNKLCRYLAQKKAWINSDIFEE